jgi:group II intron reverse transcriptase/maturase
MQNANQILQAIRKMGEKCIPLTRVYRSLFSEDLFLAAYGKIYSNQGALTPGPDNDTADGMSQERIRKLIEQLRFERFRFSPARRTCIPKKSGGKRPLGIPNFTDKLVQQVLKMILEAYYEPRFRESSHGFRPERGCHTALLRVHQKFQGTAWFIEGDIRGCFDNIDHEVLMVILSRDIQDGRLLNLIRQALKAGVLDDWKYHKTYSGTPQGGVLSPLLSNIYLHELDVYI